LSIAQTSISVDTGGQGLYEITDSVRRWTEAQNMGVGLLTVYCRHTSASLVIQENADPAVLEDLQTFFKKLAQEDPSLYRHSAEGPDDMPAHIKSALTQTSLGIPLSNGRLLLGRWQGVFLFEHRLRPHTRDIILHLTGE